MKTPNTLEIVVVDAKTVYNPLTQEYDVIEDEVTKKVPCYFTKNSQTRSLQLFGNALLETATARFMQEQEPFTYAYYNGVKYKTIDAIDSPIKGSVRLERVYE